MVVALLWAILFVVTYGFSSLLTTHPLAPWLTTIIVLLITGLLGKYLPGKEQKQ